MIDLPLSDRSGRTEERVEKTDCPVCAGARKV